MYREILKQSYWDDYKKQHRILYKELNTILCDTIFLQEIINKNEMFIKMNIYDAVINYTFKNTFEYLILKVYRSLFEKTGDVVSIDNFSNRTIPNIQVKYKICIIGPFN